MRLCSPELRILDDHFLYIRGLPFFTTLIALIHAGQPIMGIIYNHTLDEYYHAIVGHGAFMNGHSIHVSDRSMNRAFVVFGSKVKTDALVGLSDRLRHGSASKR